MERQDLFWVVFILLLIIPPLVTGWIEGGGDATCNTILCNLTGDVGYEFRKLNFIGTTGFDNLIDDVGNFTPGISINVTDLNATGRVIFSGLINCDTIDSDATGLLSCGTDDGGSTNLVDYWNMSREKVYYNNITACGDNEIMKIDGAFWNCEADVFVANSNASTACSVGEYLDGDNTCIHLNDTIDERGASTTYAPWNYTVEAGTEDEGNLTAIQIFKEGVSLNISEVGGANPIIVVINFTNVTDFNTLIIREWYTGGVGHEILVGLWDFESNTWEEEYGEITDMVGFTTSNVFVPDPTDHMNANGDVAVRFRHQQNGISSHDFYIDYVALIDGFTSTTLSDHDGLSGRDDRDNHPWAMPFDASRNFTYQINGTAAWFYDFVQIGNDQAVTNFSMNQTTWQDIIDAINFSSQVTVNCSNMMFNDGTIGSAGICDGNDASGGVADPTLINASELDNESIIRQGNESDWLATGLSNYGLFNGDINWSLAYTAAGFKYGNASAFLSGYGLYDNKNTTSVRNSIVLNITDHTNTVNHEGNATLEIEGVCWLNTTGSLWVGNTLGLSYTNITDPIWLTNATMNESVDSDAITVVENWNVSVHNITSSYSGTIKFNGSCVIINGSTSGLRIC